MGLLDLFYERGDSNKTVAKPAVTPRLNTNLRSPMPATATKAAPVAASGKAASKFNAHFARKFDEMNLAGPDYYEWSKGEEAMAAHMPDTNARRMATFAMLKTQGLTRATLLDSAAKYRAAVESDVTAYEQAVADKERTVLGPKRTQLSEARASIQREQDEIARLQAAIAARESSIAEMEADLEAEEASLNEAKGGYMAARDQALAKLDADIQYINTNITD